MRVALMVPCYIDMFYPQVGKSTLELLERLGTRCFSCLIRCESRRSAISRTICRPTNPTAAETRERS
jgi:hypothetical protein